jgi:hypothetical protein
MQLRVINDFQPFSGKPIDLFVIMNDISQAVEIALLIQNLLCHFDSIDHPEAKARMIVNFYMEIFHLNWIMFY